MTRLQRAFVTLFHLARHPLASAQGVRAALVSPSWLEGNRLRSLLALDAESSTSEPGIEAGAALDVFPDPPTGFRTARCAAYLALRGLSRLPGHRWRYSCLYRSAASCLLLRAYGVPATMRIGARADRGGRPALPAHAWTVVGDTPVTRTDADLALFRADGFDPDAAADPVNELHEPLRARRSSR